MAELWPQPRRNPPIESWRTTSLPSRLRGCWFFSSRFGSYTRRIRFAMKNCPSQLLNFWNWPRNGRDTNTHSTVTHGNTSLPLNQMNPPSLFRSQKHYPLVSGWNHLSLPDAVSRGRDMCRTATTDWRCGALYRQYNSTFQKDYRGPLN